MTVCRAGINMLILPEENGPAASLVDGLTILIASSIREVPANFTQESPLPEFIPDLENTLHPKSMNNLDFSDVRGQETAKWALEIAAGEHNVLTLWSIDPIENFQIERYGSVRISQSIFNRISEGINERTTMDIDIPQVSSSYAIARHELSHETRGFGESVSLSMVERSLSAHWNSQFGI